MAVETIIGFDSAWGDKIPGAICALSIRGDGLLEFKEPKAQNFLQAESFVNLAALKSDYLLLAIDQPTIVPNAEGFRPVEKVAGSIVNKLKGGVQPANRNKQALFGDGAPIWRFLDNMRFRQNPDDARSDTQGEFLIEVFPALSLPSMIPEIWERQRAAKYNPSNSNFSAQDWVLVVQSLMEICGRFRLAPVVEVLASYKKIVNPKKLDQDCLDAIICMMIGYIWRKDHLGSSMVIGDAAAGYMVTPVTEAIRETLIQSAIHNNVSSNWHWNEDANHQLVSGYQSEATSSPTSAEVEESRETNSTNDVQKLRDILIEAAKRREVMSYGEVVNFMNMQWSDKSRNELIRLLNKLQIQNTENSEPPLSAIVVAKSSRLPGEGFFKNLGLPDSEYDHRPAVHKQICNEIFEYDWN